MKISIIVPAYNSGDTIARCVGSILQQNCDDLEVILIDDHSTDDTYAICADLAKAHSNVRLCQTVGKGVSAARNTGLTYATGEIVGFCDADDVLDPAMLSNVCEVFAANPDLLVVTTGYYRSVIENEQVVPKERVCFSDPLRCKAEDLLEKVINDNRVMGSVCNKYFNRSRLEKCVFHTGLSHCEDMHFSVQVLLKNRSNACLVIPKPLYHYIYEGSSATNCAENLFDSDNQCKYVVAMNEIEKLQGIGDKEKNWIRYKIATLSIDMLRMHAIDSKKKEKLLENVRANKRVVIQNAIKNIGRGDYKWLIKYIIVQMKK